MIVLILEFLCKSYLSAKYKTNTGGLKIINDREQVELKNVFCSKETLLRAKVKQMTSDHGMR